MIRCVRLQGHSAPRCCHALRRYSKNLSFDLPCPTSIKRYIVPTNPIDLSICLNIQNAIAQNRRGYEAQGNLTAMPLSLWPGHALWQQNCSCAYRRCNAGGYIACADSTLQSHQPFKIGSGSIFEHIAGLRAPLLSECVTISFSNQSDFENSTMNLSCGNGER